jgi:hypothetical protein
LNRVSGAAQLAAGSPRFTDGAESECKDLESKLEVLAFERQKVVTWARKGVISDDDMGTRLAALTFEEAGLRRELAEKQMLVGGRSERLIRLALVYREKVALGAQILLDPRTPEEEKAAFDCKRKVVQGIVKRVDLHVPPKGILGTDKSTLLTLDLGESLLDDDSALYTTPPLGLPVGATPASSSGKAQPPGRFKR